MSEPKDQATGTSCVCHCYAYREASGAIDVDSISDTEDGVRLKCLEMCMGWRFEYPDRYDQDEEWQRVLQYGSVVPVAVSVRDMDTEQLPPYVEGKKQ